MEIILEVIGYITGWCICKVFTFGRYPKGGLFSPEYDSEWITLSISLLGVIGIVASIWIVYLVVDTPKTDQPQATDYSQKCKPRAICNISYSI